jgi:hypothetical protein
LISQIAEIAHMTSTFQHKILPGNLTTGFNAERGAAVSQIITEE